MCTILLVDDDADLRELWTLVLEAEGHRVVTAADGVAGMASYDKEPPDVVITDLQLPRLPGLALIARMRSLQADARIIAVSGNNAKLRRASERPRPSANRSGSQRSWQQSARLFQTNDATQTARRDSKRFCCDATSTRRGRWVCPVQRIGPGGRAKPKDGGPPQA